MAQVVQGIERITAESAALRGAVIGTVVGFVMVGAVTVAIALNAGTSVVAALGVGLFAAFWGGPGFGGMLGATLGVTRNEALQEPDSGPHG